MYLISDALLIDESRRSTRVPLKVEIKLRTDFIRECSGVHGATLLGHVNLGLAVAGEAVFEGFGWSTTTRRSRYRSLGLHGFE
jgi:hypothetical protein